MPPRAARLVLVTADGAVVGALPAIPVATPWWQDIAPVVAAVRERWGIEATILRLISASLPAPPGGEVTYLAQVDRAVSAEPWDGELDEHPLRLAYAKPCGPAHTCLGSQRKAGECGTCSLGQTPTQCFVTHHARQCNEPGALIVGQQPSAGAVGQTAAIGLTVRGEYRQSERRVVQCLDR